LSAIYHNYIDEYSSKSFTNCPKFCNFFKTFELLLARVIFSQLTYLRTLRGTGEEIRRILYQFRPFGSDEIVNDIDWSDFDFVKTLTFSDKSYREKRRRFL